MFLHLSYSIIIYSMWGGRDLNKIQTPAQGQWDLDRVGTAAGEGQEGCVAKRLPAWGYPNIAGWFILVRGKMENPWWWFVHVCSVCSCLFSTRVFPAGSKAIPWAEVKWIWAPKGVLTWLLPMLRSVWVLLSTASQHWSTSSHFNGR